MTKHPICHVMPCVSHEQRKDQIKKQEGKRDLIFVFHQVRHTYKILKKKIKIKLTNHSICHVVCVSLDEGTDKRKRKKKRHLVFEMVVSIKSAIPSLDFVKHFNF